MNPFSSLRHRSIVLLLVWGVCWLSPARADFQAGLNAARQEQYLLALKAWQPLAAEGHAPSQYNLGLMYLHGLGVPVSLAHARTWVAKAAAQGYGPAQDKLKTLPETP